MIRYDGTIPRWVVPAVLATGCLALAISGSAVPAALFGLLAVVAGVALARGSARW